MNTNTTNTAPVVNSPASVQDARQQIAAMLATGEKVTVVQEQEESTGAQFHLTIELGNDGMRTREDVAAALLQVVNYLRAGCDMMNIRDRNGKTGGAFDATDCEE